MILRIALYARFALLFIVDLFEFVWENRCDAAFQGITSLLWQWTRHFKIHIVEVARCKTELSTLCQIVHSPRSRTVIVHLRILRQTDLDAEHMFFVEDLFNFGGERDCLLSMLQKNSAAPISSVIKMHRKAITI